MKILSKSLLSFVYVIGAWAIVSCNSQEPTQLHLLASQPNGSLDAESKRMQKMQAVTVYNTETKQTEEYPVSDVIRLYFRSICGVCDSGTCESALCNADVALCQAKTLLAMTRPQTSPIVIGTLTVPLQKASTNTDLAAWAIAEAGIAANSYSAALESMSDSPRPGETACGIGNTGATLLHRGVFGAVAASAGFKDAYEVMRQATETRIQVALDTSDAELSSTVSPALGAQRSIVEWRLRVAAFAAGANATNLPFSEDGAFCTLSPPREQVRAAIAVLRDAGIDPAALSNSNLSTVALLNGTATAVPGGSVRQRIAEFYAKPELLDTTLVPSIEGYYNIDISAFEEARKGLLEEQTAFARTRERLPPRRLPSGTDSSFDSFAATASPPQRLPAAYYGALVRTNGSSAGASLYSAYNKGDSVLGAVDRSLSEYEETFHGATRNLLTVTDNLPYEVSLNGQPFNLKNYVSAAIGTISNYGDHLGHVVVEADASTFTFDAYGYDHTTDKIRVIRGERALRCAVNGNIEGVACNLVDMAPEDPALPAGAVGMYHYVYDSTLPAHFGFPRYERFRGPAPSAGSDERFYLLKPKTSASTNPVAGDYDALIGITIARGGPHMIFSILKGMDEKIARILEPSPNWCARPRFNCDGAEFDERIPLEDELTDNGDGVESSWKHYLDLAKQSAAKADELGSEYIQSGLDASQRQETVELRQQQQAQLADSYLQRLQAICGTQVDTRSLMAKLTDEGGGLQTTGGACTSTASCFGGTGAWRCEQGRCLLDIPKLLETLATSSPVDPSIQRLHDCLSDSAVSPFASLGNLPLCVWSAQANRNIVCGGATAGQCPFVKPSDQTCVQATKLPATVTVPQIVSETVPLGFLDMGSAPTSNTTAEKATDLYQVIAGGALSPSTWSSWGDRILASHVLDPIRLYDYGQRLNWEARYGGFAAITFDSVPIYETGDAVSGVKNAAWPCSLGTNSGAPYPPVVHPHDCSNDASRFDANLEMMRAVLAAKAITSVGGDDPAEQHLKLTSLPMASACGGNVVARDSQVFYKDASGMMRVTYDQGTHYVGGPAVPWSVAILNYSDHCFAPGEFALSASPNYFDNAVLADDSIITLNSDSRNQLFNYLRGKSNISVDAGSVAYLDWADERILGFDSGGHLVHTMKLSPLDYLNGIGLMARRAVAPSMVDLTKPPTVKTIDDLESVSTYLSSLAEAIRQGTGKSVFANMPDNVQDALRTSSASGAYPQFGGEMAEALSAARGALLRIRENGPLISNEVSQMGYDIREVKTSLQKANIKDDISKLQFMSTMTQQLATCASAMLSSATIDPVAAGGNAAAAGITCANSLAQIGFAQGIADLTAKDAKLDGDLAVTQFGSRFATHATSLQTLSLHLAEGQEDLDTALARIESLREEGRSQLVDAMYARSDQAAHQAEISDVIGNLFQAKQVRYQAALVNARRMAFLAKRSIEQRLGIHLAEMTDDLPLVEAPQKWEATACTFTGVNYDALKLSDSSGPQSFADGFIGDYVAKLENVVESYRLQHDFHEGVDTAVISLRDDLFNVRSKCSVQGSNLLYQAGQLDFAGNPGWRREGCMTEVVSGDTVPKADCVTATPLATGPAFADPVTSAVHGYTLSFGAGATQAAALIQSVDLAPGIYRFTWYTTGPLGSGGAKSGQVLAEPGAITIDETLPTTAPQTAWYRMSVRFTVNESGPVRIAFSKPASGTVEVSAPMLETLTPEAANGGVALLPFVNTGGNREQLQSSCEDSDGSVFRGTRWQRSCISQCPDGFGDQCKGDRAKSYCYWQTDFNINQRDIQLGRVFNFSGFARGNYNYRIDTVGLNFVGTPRGCESSDSPQACYGSGFVPFSLSHVGPFVVRNHLGELVPTKVFDGNIEHARGLATERYITNPISDTDGSLLNQYSRSEFQGRPLDGNFVLRVWDEPGVDFGAIQDVQLVLRYRYWTKFN